MVEKVPDFNQKKDEKGIDFKDWLKKLDNSHGVKDEEADGALNDTEEFKETVVLDDPETLKQAKQIIVTHFENYKPELNNADQTLHTLAVVLDELFSGDSWDGEFTGSIESSVVDVVSRLVDEIKNEFPHLEFAVNRFNHLYLSNIQKDWSPDLYKNLKLTLPDPSVLIREEEFDTAIEYYTSPECNLDEAITFSLKALRSGINNHVGNRIAHHLISEYGWDVFLEQAIAVNQSEGQSDSLYPAIVELIHKISYPGDLPREKVEALREFARDDIEWIMIDSYLELRQDTLQLSYLQAGDCREVLRLLDKHFWDEELTFQYAVNVLLEYDEAYIHFINKLNDYGYEVVLGEHPASILRRVPSVFAFNAVIDYMPDEVDSFTPESLSDTSKAEVVSSILIPEKELFDITREVTEANQEAFNYALFVTEYNKKTRKDSATLSCNKYNIISSAIEGSGEEGRHGGDKWGYVINSSAIKISKNITTVYSPTGRFLDALKTPASDEVKIDPQEIADYVSMLHILDDEHSSYTKEEQAVAVMLIFWDRLPKSWRDFFIEYFESYEVPIENWVANGPNSFEVAVSYSNVLAPIVSYIENFPEDLKKYVETAYEKATLHLDQPDTIDNQEMHTLLQREYGESALTEEEIGNIIHSLNYSTVKYLQNTFGIDFSNLKNREFLGLISYLKKSKGGKGFHNLKALADKAGGEDLAVEYIRSFISLEGRNDSFGDELVEFGLNNELAGTVFTYYGELLDSAEKAEQLVLETTDCQGDACLDLVKNVRKNILNRAQKDLEKTVRLHNQDELVNRIKNYIVTAKEYVALLQEVGRREIESVPSAYLTEEDKQQMIDLQKNNFEKLYPGTENESFRESIASSLLNSFSNPETVFYLLRDKDKIVSFNRFDKLYDSEGDEVVYFGSFNADPAYDGVGSVMLEETIKNQLKESAPMMAYCDPSQDITKKYIEDGFVVTDLVELSDKPSFEIWRSVDSEEMVKSKNKSIEELVAMKDLNHNDFLVREEREDESYSELKQGLVITRYFKKMGKTYIVFESLPEKVRNDFRLQKQEYKKVA